MKFTFRLVAAAFAVMFFLSGCSSISQKWKEMAAKQDADARAFVAEDSDTTMARVPTQGLQ
jgi:uncharacterized protein YceK